MIIPASSGRFAAGKLAKVVHMWRSKAIRGEEMLLYWKEDKEDVDDDEPYYQESDDEDS